MRNNWLEHFEAVICLPLIWVIVKLLGEDKMDKKRKPRKPKGY
jgi:hypothetical protein